MNNKRDVVRVTPDMKRQAIMCMKHIKATSMTEFVEYAVYAFHSCLLKHQEGAKFTLATKDFKVKLPYAAPFRNQGSPTSTTNEKGAEKRSVNIDIALSIKAREIIEIMISLNQGSNKSMVIRRCLTFINRNIENEKKCRHLYYSFGENGPLQSLDTEFSKIYNGLQKRTESKTTSKIDLNENFEAIKYLVKLQESCSLEHIESERKKLSPSHLSISEEEELQFLELLKLSKKHMRVKLPPNLYEYALSESELFTFRGAIAIDGQTIWLKRMSIILGARTRPNKPELLTRS